MTEFVLFWPFAKPPRRTCPDRCLVMLMAALVQAPVPPVAPGVPET